MQIFESNDNQTFIHNGITLPKNFIVIPTSVNSLAIYNCYDTKHQLISSTHFNQIEVDGIIYGSLSALTNTLTPIIYVKSNITLLSGATIGNLQQVTNLGNTTNDDIIIDGGAGIQFTQDGDTFGSIVNTGTKFGVNDGGVFGKKWSLDRTNLTDERNYILPNTGGTIALTSDLNDFQSQLSSVSATNITQTNQIISLGNTINNITGLVSSAITNGVTTSAPSEDAVYDALQGKTNSSGLTANRIPYTQSGNTILDSSRLTWDNTNSTLGINGNTWLMKFQENLNNYWLTMGNNGFGNGSLAVKNYQGKYLMILQNPTSSTGQAQLAIGNTSSIPAESQLYVYGGQNGANIDMRGSVVRDETNMDFEGNDWEVSPNSLGFSYFGSQFSSTTATTLGYPKQKMGVIRYGDTNKAIIVSNNFTGMTPIMFGINNIEIGQVNDKGFQYKSDFASGNTSNPRWITDKAYVDTAISAATSGITGASSLQDVTDIGNTTTNAIIITDGGDYTLDINAQYIEIDMTDGDKNMYHYEDTSEIGISVQDDSINQNSNLAIQPDQISLFHNNNGDTGLIEISEDSNIYINSSSGITITAPTGLYGGNIKLKATNIGLLTGGGAYAYLGANLIGSDTFFEFPAESGELLLKSNTWSNGNLYLGTSHLNENIKAFDFYSQGDDIDLPTANNVGIWAKPDEGITLTTNSDLGNTQLQMYPSLFNLINSDGIGNVTQILSDSPNYLNFYLSDGSNYNQSSLSPNGTTLETNSFEFIYGGGSDANLKIYKEDSFRLTMNDSDGIEKIALDGATGFINGVQLSLYDSVQSAYATINSDDNTILFTAADGNKTFASSQTAFAINKTNSLQGTLDVSNITSNRIYVLPNASGTIALLSDITSSITQTITNGVTGSTPSSDAVYDALALKANISGPVFTSSVTTPLIGITGYPTSLAYPNIGSTNGAGSAGIHLAIKSGNASQVAGLSTGNLSTERVFDFIDVNGKLPVIGTVAPTSASASGVTGEIRITSAFTYSCIATNTWVRSAAATW
jgi:hypothetical protein